MCSTCPVPGIQQANACTHMELEPYLTRPFPFVRQQVQVKTRCALSGRAGFDPYIGCGECHPLPDVFIEGLSGDHRDSDPAD